MHTLRCRLLLWRFCSRFDVSSVRTSASFLNLQAEPDVVAEKLSVKVNVIPSAPLDLAIKTHIDSLESQRTEAERDFFEQVTRQLVFMCRTRAERRRGVAHLV